MTNWRVILAVGVLLGATAACSSDGGSAVGTTAAAVDTTAPAPDTTAVAPDTAPPDTTAPDTTAAAAAEWEAITAPADCMCFDGAKFTYWTRTANPAKVMFFMEGGGACFDAQTCAPDSTAFKRVVGDGPTTRTDGIFDFANPANPFADWSIVYVPYCTGDIFLGDAQHDYGNGVVIEHRGSVDAKAALQHMAEAFPDATQVLVTGESAGAAPDGLYAGLAADLLPKASITILADGAGAYPDVPAINGLIGGLWGTQNAVPDWPEVKGMTAEQWSLPGLFVKATEHAPRIVSARHDYAFDETQTFFGGLAGFNSENLIELIDQNEQQIEAGGVDLLSYISPGSTHTVLGRPEFYTETLNGILLVDWVTALVTGGTVADNHCTGDCKA
jgi:hypothetical protein